MLSLERSLERGALLEAAILAKKGFADLPSVGEGEAFADWRASVEANLVRRLRGRATATWDRAVERGDWDAARDAAEALYIIEPLGVDVLEKVIEARGRTGELERAEHAYTAYMESLEANREPAARVSGAIRRVRRALDRPDPTQPRASLTPLIGRKDALEAARSLFDDMDEGRFGFVLIGGESGIGKTRLLQELHREARFKNLRCLTAQAVELESRIPLNPLIDAFREVDLHAHLEALGPPWSAVIGAVLPAGTLPEPAAKLPPIHERALPRRLLDALSLLCQRLSHEQPTVLFIDDLHWVDATTIAALQFMQRRWTRGSFGVVATVRIDLVGREHPVAKYLSKTEGLPLRRIDLRELSLHEGMQLVRQLGGGGIDEECSRRICALAGLHPIYLTELTRDYIGGRLSLPDLPTAELMIPVSLEQMLGARLQQLDDRSMKVAGYLAVGARPMRVETLAALAGIAIDDVADAIETLRRAGLVESERDRVRIVHELFRSAIYRHLGEVRRALSHRTYAAHIVAEGTADAVGELAIHYDRAGECELAARYGWLAADRAMETGTVAEAAHFYQLVTGNEQGAERRAEAMAGHARALHLARDIARGNPMLELAADRLRAVGRAAEALRLEIKRVEGLAEMGTIPIVMLSESLAHLKGQAARSADWEAMALALDVELHLLHRAGDVPGIGRVFGEMREVAGMGSTEATILANAGLALGVLFGDPKEALEAARLAVSLSPESRDYRLLALIRLMVVLHYQGMLEMPESAPIIAEARALAERSGDVLLRFSIESNLAVASLDAGDIERAEVLMGRATVLLGAAVMDISRFNQTNNLAELALAQREYGKASDAFTEAASYLGPTMPSYMQDLVNAGMGLCALETGDLAEARRREQELPPVPETWHFDPTTIVAFRARLLDRRGRHLEALELLESSAKDLRSRLVLAWFKIRSLQVRLMIRRKVDGARSVALEAKTEAAYLCLSDRVEEFDSLLNSGGAMKS
jgi:tetratricopeptide (TPR) repeat protein